MDAFLENAKSFVNLIRSDEGDKFIERWLSQLQEDAVRERKIKSQVNYIYDENNNIKEELDDVA